MPLIKCHECSTQVSDHARICPKCGAPVIATIKRRQKAALIDLVIRAGFALIIVTVSLVWFHHATRKFIAPVEKAIKEQQSQQQQRQMTAASPPMVVPILPPPVQQPLPEPSWVKQIKLGGINGDSDHRFAIINGKTFEAGDAATVKITGKSITIHCLEIGESTVTISFDGIDGSRELKLSEN